MKVVIYVNSLTSGGAERFVSYLASYLADCGEDVTVLTLKTTEIDYYKLNEKVRRLCLRTSSGGPFLKTRRCLALRDVIKSEKADVLVGIQTTNAVLSILAAWGLPTKVVVCERNYPAINKVSWVYVLLRRLLYRFADLSVAQTERAAEWLKKNTKIRNIVVIPNPVSWPLPVVSPEVDPALHIGPSDKCILAVGSLRKIHQKGFDLLVRGFGMIAEHCPDWKLLIIGTDGKDNKSSQMLDLQSQVDELGLAGRVCFPGRVGNVSDWYGRADIFVLSSRYEGMPNVLLEAMASGCACVAFDCDTGPREIITHDSDGMLVPLGDVKSLASTMDLLMHNASRRARLGKNALSVRERFACEKVLSNWRKAIGSMFGDLL